MLFFSDWSGTFSKWGRLVAHLSSFKTKRSYVWSFYQNQVIKSCGCDWMWLLMNANHASQITEASVSNLIGLTFRALIAVISCVVYFILAYLSLLGLIFSVITLPLRLHWLTSGVLNQSIQSMAFQYLLCSDHHGNDEPAVLVYILTSSSSHPRTRQLLPLWYLLVLRTLLAPITSLVWQPNQTARSFLHLFAHL